ncbi:hypothetical protein FACS1894199_04580 [Bacteroidia bacterium]|nr:hypothetical protein FACS1894199_04580 [Bacteroidia bacterium]
MMTKEEILQKIERTIGKDAVPESEIWNRVRKLCEDEFQQFLPNSPLKPAAQFVTEFEQMRGCQTRYIPTDFYDLDKLLCGGFSEGEFVVIGGRPMAGKTLLLTLLSLNISKTLPVLFLSYELAEHLLFSRIISTLSTLPIEKILQRSTLDSAESLLMKDALQQLENRSLYITDKRLNFDMLIADCVKQIEEHGIKMIMLDYIQLLCYSSNRKYNRDAEIDEICRKLRELAKKCNVCIVAASQLNRGVECRSGDAKRPMLCDLRDSGGIEEHADKVILLNRPENYGILTDATGVSTKDKVELILAKNASGSIGEAVLLFDTLINRLVNKLNIDVFKNRLSELGLDQFNKLVNDWELKEAPF